jgi:hypothetical protein
MVTPLGLLIAAAPFLLKPVIEIASNFCVSSLPDNLFRRAYSQLFMTLYVLLAKNFCLGLGTESNSILHTTCQILTVDSVVRLLSLPGIGSRIYSEGDNTPLTISDRIAVALKVCARLCGLATEDDGNRDFHKNPALRHRRYRALFSDMTFVFQNGDQAIEVLGNEEDRTVSPCSAECSRYVGSCVCVL